MPKQGQPMSEDQKNKIRIANTQSATPSEKKCAVCKIVKPAEAFGRRSINPKLLRGECRECGKMSSRKWARAHVDYVKEVNHHGSFRRRGITKKEYNEFLTAQHGVCAICKGPQRLGSRFFIDHHHETGAVRGLLCANCNSAIGFLKDNADNCRQAAEYLDAHAR